MTRTSDLAARMKEYEDVSRAHLTRRLPVLGRLDGKAFHTFCRGMERPWDERFVRCMDATAVALCENIQGCRMAYVQSDEITVLLVDYDTVKTEAWFDYGVQKMCSVAASTATAAFLRAYLQEFPDRAQKSLASGRGLPLFDARFWSVPLHEVANALLWRQQDAVRNSIASLGQAHFSPRQLHGKSINEVQEMLFQQHGVNWNDTPAGLKRGRVVCRTRMEVQTDHGPVLRHRWIINPETPHFHSEEGRAQVEEWIRPRGEE